MADLAVAHDPQRQPHLLATGVEQGVRIPPEQLMEVGRAGKDRVRFRLDSMPPAVQDHEQQGALQLATSRAGYSVGRDTPN